MNFLAVICLTFASLSAFVASASIITLPTELNKNLEDSVSRNHLRGSPVELKKNSTNGVPSVLDFSTPGCGSSLYGWELQKDSLPEGTWKSVVAANVATCAAECAIMKGGCLAAMWRDMSLSVAVNQFTNNTQCELVTELTSIRKSDFPHGINYWSPCTFGCGAKWKGFQHYPAVSPRGRMSKYSAKSMDGCIQGCHEDKRCVAASWEEDSILPFGVLAKCHHVRRLVGFSGGMPLGVHLLTKC